VLPFQLPRGVAPNVDVELVEPGIVTVASELDLELHLVLGDGHPADLTKRANTGTAPCAGRGAGRELARLDSGSGFLAEDRLVRHLAVSEPREAVA